MKIYKYIEMHAEKYLFEIIKEYIRNKVQNYVKFVKNICRKICWIFNLYLETSGLHYFLN